MRPSQLLPVFMLLVCANSTAAQTPSPAPLEVIRLVGGSGLGLIELTPFRGLDQDEILHEMEDVGEFGKRTHSNVEEAAKFPRSLLR